MQGGRKIAQIFSSPSTHVSIQTTQTRFLTPATVQEDETWLLRHLWVLMDADYAMKPESDPDRQACLWEESLGLRTSPIYS